MSEPGPLETKEFDELVGELLRRFQGVIVLGCRQIDAAGEWEVKHRIQGGPFLTVGMLNYLSIVVGNLTRQQLGHANQRLFDDTQPPQAPPDEPEHINLDELPNRPIDFEGDLPKTPQDFLDELDDDDGLGDPYA